jgi:hypothetical protein
MTHEQMLHRAEQAEKLNLRLAEIERARENEGLLEQALEARRLRHDQEAAALYWRDRATSAIAT